jgi:hypothetical protein
MDAVLWYATMTDFAGPVMVARHFFNGPGKPNVNYNS